jgi:dipeptidyl-peptidase-4
VALTSDGDDLMVNGTGDWVNEEEFDLRDGFLWSPDSQHVAYWQFDTEGVGTFTMMDNLAGVYSRPVPLQYPKAGTTNSAVRVGVVAASGGPTTWVQLEDDPRQTYVPAMEWADNSNELILQHMNRQQNRNTVLLVDVATGQPRTVLVETDAAWVDVNDNLTWFDEGAHFTWLSERDGWRRLYRVARDSGQAEPITPAGADVIQLVSINTEQAWVYYLASPQDNAGRYLYRSPLSGGGSAERLTPAGPSSVHAYTISADARWAIHTHSRLDAPPTVSLVALPDHAVRQVIVDNAVARERLAATPRGALEFFRVPVADGTLLDGWMMFPPDFDPARQYPLLMLVYGEPASQTVLNQWGGDRYLWHLLLAQQGYIVASVDNHGTPAPRGRDWRKSIYGQIGILASVDQAQAVQALLAARPYLDPERVGVWGWSGGGSMTLNAMFRYPEIYRTGIAIAHVADQRLYDTIYQERYMGLPQDNPEGFRLGSPITHAGGLTGDLLIIHGTGDDNVHYQSTEQLIDRLVALDRDFELMVYPNRAHGISEGRNTSRHLYRTMTQFLLEHLPPDAGETD